MNHPHLLLYVVICLVPIHGCALMLVGARQPVEIISPSQARLVTPYGESFHLDEGYNGLIYLKRSRPDPTMRIYCPGASRPEYQPFRTRPNLVFLLGNLLIFPYGHIIDLFLNTSYDYQDTVTLNHSCPSITGWGSRAQQKSSSTTPQKYAKIFSRYVDEFDGTSLVMSRTYHAKTDDGRTIGLQFSLFDSAYDHVYVLFYDRDLKCLDETSHLDMIFQNGQRAHFIRTGDFECNGSGMIGFTIDVSTFPSAPIKAMRVTYRHAYNTKTSFMIKKTMTPELSKLIRYTIKEAGLIFRNERKMKEVMTN